MSDFDLYHGQNCPCGNDSGCNNCGSGAEAERQWQEEMARQQEAEERAQAVHSETDA
jgi:hypothetical protein